VADTSTGEPARARASVPVGVSESRRRGSSQWPQATVTGRSIPGSLIPVPPDSLIRPGNGGGVPADSRFARTRNGKLEQGRGAPVSRFRARVARNLNGNRGPSPHSSWPQIGKGGASESLRYPPRSESSARGPQWARCCLQVRTFAAAEMRILACPRRTGRTGPGTLSTRNLKAQTAAHWHWQNGGGGAC
jgi:hypothetical protein